MSHTHHAYTVISVVLSMFSKLPLTYRAYCRNNMYKLKKNKQKQQLLAPIHNNSCLKALRAGPYYRENPNNQMIPFEQHLATVGRNNSLLTGRDLWHNQAQGGAATYRDRLGVRGKKRKESTERPWKMHKLRERVDKS